ncbi:MAG TPA: hypothetical protein VK387_04430 [Thermoleophilaceae bacterium]|nr:hypothetical protein [Thermoleophilaceae bacterium]
MVEVGRLGVDLGERRGADRELVLARDQLDQLGRVLEPARGLAPLRLALRRVAAQREHVLDADLAHLVERRAQLLDRRPDAREVGHRLDIGLLLDPADDVQGAVARRAERAVGHRDERRVVVLELGDGLEQPLGALVVLGREELEREAGASLLEDLVDAHGATG